MQSKTIKGRTSEVIAILLEESLADGFMPTLAIIFIHQQNEVKAINELFKKRNISVFGASSFGHFINKDHEIDSIVVMLLNINPEHFRIEFRETGKSSTMEIAQSIAEAGKTAFNKPAFIIVSGGIRTNGEKIIEGIEDGAGKDVTIFGGLAASDFQTMISFVFTNENFTDNGLVAIILDEEKIGIKDYATGGCQPLGIFHTITKSEDNIVYTIDDQPAFDLVLRYCGKQNEELSKQVNVLNISQSFQIQLYRENDSFIMRTIMFMNPEDRSIVFAGSLPQGAKVKFSILPGFEAVDNVVNEFTEFGKQVPEADAVILFSCQGREIAFGPWMGEEIDRLQKIWNSPMIGLFSFGEIGNSGDGKNEFYNMTCSLAILKEKTQ